ncbi:MAG: hypothetical protein ACE5JG_13015 [Planctomycetota bacterium]
MSWGLGFGLKRRITRPAADVRATFKRRDRPRAGRPVGPKLVEGRGLARRRPDRTAPLRWTVYLLLAVALFVLLTKALLW